MGFALAALTLGAVAEPSDVHFMSAMILHHAQAVLMAGWAPTHDASPAVLTLCARIAVSQRDEIDLMARWLTDHHVAVPDTSVAMTDQALMPGMLTTAQLAQLDSARGTDFDHLFLTDMIRHHQGAVAMVNELLTAPGAAQDNLVYQLATDVSAGQMAEIARMRGLLAALPPRSSPPVPKRP